MIAPIYIYTKCINQPYSGKKATMNSKHIFFVQVLYPFLYMRKNTVKKAALQFGFLNLASYLKIWVFLSTNPNWILYIVLHLLYKTYTVQLNLSLVLQTYLLFLSVLYFPYEQAIAVRTALPY